MLLHALAPMLRRIVLSTAKLEKQCTLKPSMTASVAAFISAALLHEAKLRCILLQQTTSTALTKSTHPLQLFRVVFSNPGRNPPRWRRQPVGCNIVGATYARHDET